MKTLSIAQGRSRLGYWLKKAVEGQDIAFAFEGHIVALRPVAIYSEDYALREYGATPEVPARAGRVVFRGTRRGGRRTPATAGGVRPDAPAYGSVNPAAPAELV